MGKVQCTTVSGEIIAEKRNGVRSLYVPDALGSTVALLDNTQTITDTFSYFPSGTVASRTGTTATPFQFVGTKGYHSDASGKTYVRARILEPQKGRWLTEDPIGFGGGDGNLYRYAFDNPISWLDPSGLWCFRIIGSICIGNTCYTRKDCPPRSAPRRPGTPVSSPIPGKPASPTTPPCFPQNPCAPWINFPHCSKACVRSQNNQDYGDQCDDCCEELGQLTPPLTEDKEVYITACLVACNKGLFPLPGTPIW